MRHADFIHFEPKTRFTRRELVMTAPATGAGTPTYPDTPRGNGVA
jgi:hypothetical protein